MIIPGIMASVPFGSSPGGAIPQVLWTYTTGSSSISTSKTPSYPVAAAAGQYCIVFAGTHGRAVTAPAGWTLLGSSIMTGVYSGPPRVYAYGKVLTSSDISAPIAFTLASSSYFQLMTVGLDVFSSVAESLSDWSTSAFSGSHNWDIFTTTGAGCVLAVHMQFARSGTSTTDQAQDITAQPTYSLAGFFGYGPSGGLAGDGGRMRIVHSSTFPAGAIGLRSASSFSTQVFAILMMRLV